MEKEGRITLYSSQRPRRVPRGGTVVTSGRPLIGLSFSAFYTSKKVDIPLGRASRARASALRSEALYRKIFSAPEAIKEKGKKEGGGGELGREI